MHELSRAPVWALALAVLLPVTACDTLGLGGDADLVGTWTLESLDGEAVPVVEYEDEFEREIITGATLGLRDDGSLTLAVDLDMLDKESSSTSSYTETATGTYQESDGDLTVTLLWPDDDSPEQLSGTVDGDEIVITGLEGEAIVFRKVSDEVPDVQDAPALHGGWSLRTVDSQELPVVTYEDSAEIETTISAHLDISGPQMGTLEAEVELKDKSTQDSRVVIIAADVGYVANSDGSFQLQLTWREVDWEDETWIATVSGDILTWTGNGSQLEWVRDG